MLKYEPFLFKLYSSFQYVNSRAEISARAEISPCNQPFTGISLKKFQYFKLKFCFINEFDICSFIPFHTFLQQLKNQSQLLNEQQGRGTLVCKYNKNFDVSSKDCIGKLLLVEFFISKILRLLSKR